MMNFRAFTPNTPTAVKGEVRREGFWSSTEERNLPMPKAARKPFPEKEEVLEALRHKESKAHETRFKGWSTCRVCGAHNGSSEYSLNGWKWPEGFQHYVKDHNVKPTDAFLTFLGVKI